MNTDELEIYCNGETFTYDIPDIWPQCSDLAVCSPVNIVSGVMQSFLPKGAYIMEDQIVQYVSRLLYGR